MTTAAALAGTRATAAARKALLGRRSKIARLASNGERDRQELSTGHHREQLAINEEIAGPIAELTEHERAELHEIDAALERLDAGTWGVCERCNGKIARARLAVMPEARHCIAC